MEYDSGCGENIKMSLKDDVSLLEFWDDGIYTDTFTCTEDIQGTSIKVTVSGYQNWASFNDNFIMNIIEK